MAEKKENRRIRMTKQLLKNALLELMEEKALSDITVTSICETADVHRATFYHYYSNTIDLLGDIEQDFLDRIPKPSQFRGSPEHSELIDATAAFFDYVKENRKAFRILFSAAANNSFQSRLVDFLCDGYIPDVSGTAAAAGMVRCYIANGITGTLREWVFRNFPVGSREIAEMLYGMSRSVLHFR